MTTKAEPKHRGTLVCVVLKAKNLPNKRSIGKQDPYCVLQMGTEQQKTKPDKRGGQHPTWDEQLHFEIYDDMEDQLRKTDPDASKTSSSAALSQATKRKEKAAGKTMRVSCYADDNKEPEFIGEGVVDLSDTLRSGEFDEWVTIKAKDRYAGEVYLELTFYSSAAPPKPKKVLKPAVPANTTYGGAGTFSEDFDESEFAPRPPSKPSGHAPIPSSFTRNNGLVSNSLLSQHPSRAQSGSSMTTSQSLAQMGNGPTSSDVGASRSAHIDGVPSSLRPSMSMAQMDTYTPPYAPSHIQRERSPAPTHTITASAPRRDSFPPLTQSASAQLYGHRLPDAAPSNIVAQRIEEEAAAAQNSRRHSQQISSSSTFHHLPQSSSVSTVRANSYRDNSIDDLVRPLSSMSMQTLPTVAEARHQVGPSSAVQYPPYAPGPPLQQQQQQQQPLPNAMYSGYGGAAPTVDQFGRPIGSAIVQQGTASSVHSYSPVPPTPPVHPNSAPPAAMQPYETGHQHHQPWSQSTVHQQPNQHASLSSQPSVQQHLAQAASSHPSHRPTSPAPNPGYTGTAGGQMAAAAGTPLPPPPQPPLRSHTPSMVYALPPQDASIAGRAPSPLPYAVNASASMQSHMSSAGYGQVSNSPPKASVSRPLPPTGPSYEQQQQQHQQIQPSAMVSSPSTYGPQGGYYANQQQPSPSTQWPQQPPPGTQSPAPPLQQQHPQHAYAGYPPPPPSSTDAMYTTYAPAPQPSALPPSVSSSAPLTHYPPPPPGPSPGPTPGPPPPADYNHYAYAPHAQHPSYQQQPAPAHPTYPYQHPSSPAPPSIMQHQQPVQHQQQQQQSQPGQQQAPPPTHPHPPASYYQGQQHPYTQAPSPYQ